MTFSSVDAARHDGVRGRWKALLHGSCEGVHRLVGVDTFQGPADRRLLLALVLSTAVLAPVAARPAVGAPTAPAVDLRDALRPVVAADAPGAIALVADGRRTHSAAAPTADLDTGRRMRTGDHVRIGSVTKTCVAVVALQLAAEDRLDLDAPVGPWLPGVLPYADRITVRQLLNHTSGVPDYVDKLPQYNAPRPGTPQLRHWEPRELVGFVVGDPPLFADGSGWQSPTPTTSSSA